MPDRPRISTRHPGVAYREKADSSRQYMIWYTGTDGKPRWQNTPGGEKDAVRARAKIVDRIAHGHKVAPSRTLFADFARSWLEERQNLAPKSVESYRNSIETHLIPRLGPRMKLCDVDVDSVARLIDSMRKEGFKAWTIRTTLTPLGGIMTTATRRGLAPANPVLQLERAERPKGDQAKMNILDTDEIGLLLNNAPDNWRMLFAAAVFTGLRVSELLSLRWEDVDWAEGVLRVRGTKTKQAEREVVLMPTLQRQLASHSLETNNYAGSNVFAGDRKSALFALKRTLKKAGIEKHVRFHDLRHTFASILISEGYDLAYVAEQMGHANISTTLNTYAKLIDRKKKREAARMKMESAYGEVLA